MAGLRHRAGQDARVGATRQQLLGVRETGARRLAPAEGGEHARVGHRRGGPFEDSGAAPREFARTRELALGLRQAPLELRGAAAGQMADHGREVLADPLLVRGLGQQRKAGLRAVMLDGVERE